jgi:hypothetical protein
MRAVLRALLLLQALVPVHALAADEKLSIELNSTETAENRCRMNFVVENKSNVALESMKLDMVAFSVDGAILRRLLIEMGPVRATKTLVRTFVFDDECRRSARCWSTMWRPVPPANPAPASTASPCRRASKRFVSTSSSQVHCGHREPTHAFIDSKNSPLFLVLRSLSSRKSMASIVPIGLRMRRRMYIFLS